MPLDPRYAAQVRLLVQTRPLLAVEDCFALKGGTAINLFEGCSFVNFTNPLEAVIDV